MHIIAITTDQEVGFISSKITDKIFLNSFYLVGFTTNLVFTNITYPYLFSQNKTPKSDYLYLSERLLIYMFF